MKFQIHISPRREEEVLTIFAETFFVHPNSVGICVWAIDPEQEGRERIYAFTRPVQDSIPCTNQKLQFVPSTLKIKLERKYVSRGQEQELNRGERS
jgi:hypothetical protein